MKLKLVIECDLSNGVNNPEQLAAAISRISALLETKPEIKTETVATQQPKTQPEPKAKRAYNRKPKNVDEAMKLVEAAYYRRHPQTIEEELKAALPPRQKRKYVRKAAHHVNNTR